MSEQQPTDDVYTEHPDLEAATLVDDHGPAFEPPGDDEADDE